MLQLSLSRNLWHFLILVVPLSSLTQLMGRPKTFCWQYWVRVLRGGDFLGKKRLSTLIFRWLSTFSSKLFCYLLKALFGSLTVAALFDPLSFQKKTGPAGNFEIKWGQAYVLGVFIRSSSNFCSKKLILNLYRSLSELPPDYSKRKQT